MAWVLTRLAVPTDGAVHAVATVTAASASVASLRLRLLLWCGRRKGEGGLQREGRRRALLPPGACGEEEGIPWESWGEGGTPKEEPHVQKAGRAAFPLPRGGVWGRGAPSPLTRAVLVDGGAVGLQSPVHHGGVFVSATTSRAASAVAERLGLAGISVSGLLGLGVLQQAVGVAVRVPQDCGEEGPVGRQAPPLAVGQAEGDSSRPPIPPDRPPPPRRPLLPPGRT